MTTSPLRPGATFPLRAYVDKGVVALRIPPAIWRRRGLVSMFAAPTVIAMLTLVAGFNIGAGSPAVESTLVISGSVLCGASFLYGAALAAFAGRWAARSEIRIDTTQRRVQRARDGRALSFDEISQLRVRRGVGWQRASVLEFVGTNGEVLLPLHGKLAEAHAHDADQLVAFLMPYFAPTTYRDGQSVSATETVAPREYLLSVKTAAMLCYLPLFGPNFYFQRMVVQTDDRPEALFGARQASMHTWGSVLLWAVISLLVAVPSVCFEGTPAHAPLLTLYLVLCGACYALWLTGTMIAFVQAARGRTWRMPWLRPFAKRFGLGGSSSSAP